MWLMKCGARCHWCALYWNLVQLIRERCMSSFVILSQSGKKSKVNCGQRSQFGVTWKFCLVCAQSNESIFVWVSYFILLLFSTRSGERSWFLDTFANVSRISWLTSTNIGQWNCEWWNGVISGIDAHGNWIWPIWLGDTVWAILSHAAVVCQIHKKLVESELWAEVTDVTIWGHIKILPGMCPVIWDHFCLGVVFHSVAFLHLKWWEVMIFGHIWKCSGISWPTSTNIGEGNCEWWMGS